MGQKTFKLLNDNPTLIENVVDVNLVEFMNYVKYDRVKVSHFSQMIMAIISCFPELELNILHQGRCSLVQNKALITISIGKNDSRTVSITLSEFDHALNFLKESQVFSANLLSYLYRIYDILILEHEALNYLDKAMKVFNTQINCKFKDSDLFLN